MDFKEANKELRRVGTAHAQGDALKAMYAKLISTAQGGSENLYYSHLQKSAGDTENDIRAKALPLIRSRAAAWDVLLGNL